MSGYIIVRNEDLDEPFCFDEYGNVLDVYAPDCVVEGDIMVTEDGYVYFRPDGERFFWDDYIASGHDIEQYVDIAIDYGGDFEDKELLKHVEAFLGKKEAFVGKRGISEEDALIEKELEGYGADEVVDYKIKPREKAPSGVIKPEKKEKFPLVEGEVKKMLIRLDNKISKIIDLYNIIQQKKDEIKELNKELEKLEMDFSEAQELKLDVIWEELEKQYGVVDKFLKVAMQYKAKGWDVLIAFDKEIEFEERDRLLSKSADTILDIGKKLGLITDEMIEVIEKEIDAFNKKVLKGIKEYKELRLLHIWPPAKSDQSKLSFYIEKVAGFWDMFKSWISKFVGIISDWFVTVKETTLKLFGLETKVEDIEKELSELDGYLVVATIDVDILSPNVVKVGEDLIVEKDYEVLLEKAYEKLASVIKDEKVVLSLLEESVNKFKFDERNAKWDKLPKGWTAESVKKFWNSLTGDAEHKVTMCMKKMEGIVDDPGAFCASLKDIVEGTTKWRGKE